MRSIALAAGLLCLAGCSDPAKELRRTTVPTYDKQTGRLKQLTSDYNKNGTIDTWTEMEGARPVFTKQDRNEDGRIDRWEYYDSSGRLAKVGFSRRDDGRPDAWAYPGPDGRIQRVEISFVADEKKIGRWEFFEADVLARSEEDADADGRPDKWETYSNGAVVTAAFDDDGDGRPNRRLTYDGRNLAFIETEPDASGTFTKKVAAR